MDGKKDIRKAGRLLGRILLIGVALSIFSSRASADEGKGHGHSEGEREKTSHGHTAPHGGIISHAGKYDLELLVKDQEVILICPTLEGKPAPMVDKEAKLFVQFPDNRNQSVSLTPIVFENAPCLEGKVHLAGAEAFKASVSLKIDGASRVAKFSYMTKPHLDTR
ncbi:MAG: hypothetical protein EPO39_06200 [Candidatus Manganitrophaceae bacterium]|nr:MAG: hypothetical protein EPO39_06200 [Candidatus Manganitrophaceae bacterium]